MKGSTIAIIMGAGIAMDDLPIIHENTALPGEHVCQSECENFICTKAKGHDGDHEAHTLFGTIAHSWEDQ